MARAFDRMSMCVTAEPLHQCRSSPWGRRSAPPRRPL